MKSKGYTLIEILVGLTIIAILFAIGYVNFRDFARRQAIAGAAKLLQGDIRLAQQQALSGQKPDDPKCKDPNILNGYFFDITSDTEYKVYASCSGGNVAPTKDVILPTGLTITSTLNPVLFKVLGDGTNIPQGQASFIKMTQAVTGNTISITITRGGDVQ